MPLKTNVITPLIGMHPFGDAAGPALPDGNNVFVATVAGAQGAILDFNPSGQYSEALYSFSGQESGPTGQMVLSNGALFGVTSGLGTPNEPGSVFKIDLASGVETELHQFGGAGDGLRPAGGLTLMNGLLYGVTQYGGDLNGKTCKPKKYTCPGGTIFSIDPATGVETVLHTFRGVDGDGPQTPLVAVSGVLFGTTSLGGPTNQGTLFKLKP
jgi:uncharacterized repeat protein (TIGR03803 family)